MTEDHCQLNSYILKPEGMGYKEKFSHGNSL